MAQCLHGDGAKLVLRNPGPVLDEGQEVDADIFSGVPGLARESIKLITANGTFQTNVQLLEFDARSAADLISISGYQRLGVPEEDTRDIALQALAQAFLGPATDTPAANNPLPAIYTYFGQFIAHEVSRLYRPEDGVFKNLNTSSFDLDTVFHPATKFQSALQNRAPYCDIFGAAALGNTAPVATIYLADLPRDVAGAPLVPDCRNDASPMLSQLHVAILQKYRSLLPTYGLEATVVLKTLLHAITIHDYLKEIIDDCVYQDVLANGRKLVNSQQNPPQYFLTPIEFAAGAFRFGHAMVRSSYRWSRTVLQRQAELPELLLHTHARGGLFPDGLPVARRMPTDWTMDKADMLQLQGMPAPNLANRICPALSSGLQELHHSLVPNSDQQDVNLAEKTLRRGQEVMLACAQSLWALLEPNCGPFLTPDQITGLPGSRFHTALTLKELGKPTLAERTPLWFYILRESEVLHGGRKLGPLGGRIVMETIHAAISAAGSNPQCLQQATLADLFDPTTTQSFRRMA